MTSEMSTILVGDLSTTDMNC